MNIIQTWKTNNIPHEYHHNIENIRQLNPDWNYVFFNDDDIVDFIKEKMPQYYNVFVNMKHKIQQIDFFRYLAVYYYGGVYMDLDVENIKCLDNLYYEYRDQCIFPIELYNITDSIITNQGYTNLIGNYAFYSPPNHPFLKAIIDNIVCQRISPENIRIAQSENGDPPSQVYVYCTTGPLLVTQTALDYGVDSLVLLSSTTYDPNCFGDYGIHRCYGSWKHNTTNNTLM